jgi:hypothetical protein
MFNSIIKITVIIASLIVIIEKVLSIIDFIIENNKTSVDTYENMCPYFVEKEE